MKLLIAGALLVGFSAVADHHEEKKETATTTTTTTTTKKPTAKVKPSKPADHKDHKTTTPDAQTN